MFHNRNAVRYRITVEYDHYGAARTISDFLRPSALRRFTFEALDANGVALWTEDGDPAEAINRPEPQQHQEGLPS